MKLEANVNARKDILDGQKEEIRIKLMRLELGRYRFEFDRYEEEAEKAEKKAKKAATEPRSSKCKKRRIVSDCSQKPIY